MMLKDQLSYLKDQEIREERLLRVKKELQQLTDKLDIQIFRFFEICLLIQTMPLLDHIIIPEDIYAIFPIRVARKVYSFVITEMGLYYVAMTPLALVNQLSVATNRYPFDPYARKGTVQVLGDNSRKISYGNSSYTLMPLSSFKNWDNIWVNPAYIEGTINLGGVTYNRFSFGLTIESPISEEALIEGIASSFIIHGLFARRKLQRVYSQKESLSHFLQIRSTPLVLRAIKGLTVKDIPGDNDSLHLSMYRVYAKERGIVV